MSHETPDTAVHANHVSGNGGLWKGMLIGGIIGAAAALLFAPKPGRELRKDLREKSMEAADYAKRQAATLADQAKTAAQAAGRQASVLTSKMQELAVRAKQQTADEVAAAAEAASQAIRHVEQAADNLTDQAAAAAETISLHAEAAAGEVAKNKEEKS